MPIVRSVRFALESYDSVRKSAEQSGLRISKFLRVAALERAAGRLAVLDPAERRLLAELLAELRRQGANLNQYAFAANKVAAALNRESVLPATASVERTSRDVSAAVDRLIAILLPLETRLRPGER